METTIYHIVANDDWQKFSELDFYEAESLHTEGFIHLSKSSQVGATLNRYFVGANGLLLLHIYTLVLGDALVYESSPNDELFPHLYSRLSKSAVTNVETLVPNADGSWVWNGESDSSLD
jgi:uncharacterized protein (DUF952 family)